MRFIRIQTLSALIALGAVAGLVNPVPVQASPLATKQAAARKLDKEVRALEVKYDALQERHRGALHERDKIAGDVKSAQRDVKSTKKNLGVARQRLSHRADSIYRRGGNASELFTLASGGSFRGFFDRVEAVQRVSEQDSSVLDTVRALNEKYVRKQATLSKQLKRQRAVVKRAEKDAREMDELRSARQAKLDSVNSEIRSIMEAQRRAAEARAARAARESASLARLNTPSTSSSTTSSNTKDAQPTMAIALPPSSGTASSAASAAMTRLGKPYVWAGSGPDTFDCSGLVMWAFAQAGRGGMPHSSYALAGMGVGVPLDQLQVGDLVFPSHNGHVGIYVGGGSFVHAPSSGDVVKVTSMSHYSIAHARRI